MAVTLDRLKSFVVLARVGNFHQTAAVIGRTQPAVTAQIKSLEEALSVPLFFRRTRSVELTPEGEVLFARVERIVDEIDEIVHDFRRIATLETGEVRVGATPTLASYMLPDIMRKFRQQFPDVRLHFTDEPTTRLEQLVADRALDFYFGPAPSRASALSFKFLANDPYQVVVPKNHELAHAARVSVAELPRYRVLLMHKNTMVRKEIDRFLARHSIFIEPEEEVTNHFTLGGLVEAGIGITLLPATALPLIAHPGVRVVDLIEADFVRRLGVATRVDYRPAPAAKAFLTMISPHVRRYCSAGAGRT
ncbi:MAG: LysR family transcriptional regulator [Rhizobiaceae bacterium]